MLEEEVYGAISPIWDPDFKQPTNSNLTVGPLVSEKGFLLTFKRLITVWHIYHSHIC